MDRETPLLCYGDVAVGGDGLQVLVLVGVVTVLNKQPNGLTACTLPDLSSYKLLTISELF
jgi:hypothetical protein